MSGSIDVHHHYLSQAYLDTIGAERVAAEGSSKSVSPWTDEQSLEFMAVAGIDTAIVSVSSPGLGLSTAAKTADFARACNDAMAAMTARHVGKFGMLACVPLPDIDASLTEAARALDTLKADGIGVLTNYQGDYIGSPKFWPLFEELDRRSAVVQVHPTSPAGFTGFAEVSASSVEFPFDSARAIVSVLHYGVPSRFPNIRFIWTHGGGAMPSIAGRLAVLSMRNAAFVEKGDALLKAMSNFYFDMTQSTNNATVGALRQLVGDDHLLFGSDCPMAKLPQIGQANSDLDALAAAEPALAAIRRANAEKLFPRFAAK